MDTNSSSDQRFELAVFERLVGSAPVPMLLCDVDGTVQCANDSAALLAPDMAAGHRVRVLAVTGSDTGSVLRAAARSTIPVPVSLDLPGGRMVFRAWRIEPAADAAPARLMLMAETPRSLVSRLNPGQEVGTEVARQLDRIEAERQRLRQQARRLLQLTEMDTLTGLLQKGIFERKVRRILAGTDEEGAMVFVDLDGFKQVNDTLGHDAGDSVLRQVAEALTATIRTNDMAARLGGDEFGLWLRGARRDDLVDIRARIDRALERITAKLVKDGARLRVSASLGASFAPQEGRDVGALLRLADARMYDRKFAARAARPDRA